jgi:hypothetical protein
MGSIIPVNWSENNEEASKKTRIKYFALYHFRLTSGTLLLFNELTMLLRVPSGHTHPQNTLPSTIVRITTIIDRKKVVCTVCEDRSVEIKIMGSKSRNNLTG